MAISLLQEIGYLQGTLSRDLVKAAFEVLKPHERRHVDQRFLDEIEEEFKAALATTIGGWDWVCVHQPAIVWFNCTVSRKKSPELFVFHRPKRSIMFTGLAIGGCRIFGPLFTDKCFQPVTKSFRAG